MRARFIMSKDKLYGFIENLMVLTLPEKFSLSLLVSLLGVFKIIKGLKGKHTKTLRVFGYDRSTHKENHHEPAI